MMKSTAILILAILVGTSAVSPSQVNVTTGTAIVAPVHPGTALLDSMGIYAGAPIPVDGPLCPGFVRKRIWESGRNRRERYGPPLTPDPASPAGRLLAQLAEYGQSGLDLCDVAAQVLNAVRGNELYVCTHHSAGWQAESKEQFDMILMAMDEAAARQRLNI